MLLYTYQLRRRGFRKGVLAMSMDRPKRGHLIYDQSPFDYGRPVKMARLLCPESKDLIAPLEQARIRVREREIMVTGIEKAYASSKDHGTPFRQSWLCVLSPIDFSLDERYQAQMRKISLMAIIPHDE